MPREVCFHLLAGFEFSIVSVLFPEVSLRPDYCKSITVKESGDILSCFFKVVCSAFWRRSFVDVRKRGNVVLFFSYFLDSSGREVRGREDASGNSWGKTGLGDCQNRFTGFLARETDGVDGNSTQSDW